MRREGVGASPDTRSEVRDTLFDGWDRADSRLPELPGGRTILSKSLGGIRGFIAGVGLLL
jgi:hypothetical protein